LFFNLYRWLFLTYKAKVENQLNNQIKRIKLDRRVEFVLFNDYYFKEGIIHEVTPTYSDESS